MDPRKRIIVALDVPTLEQAGELVDQLVGHVGLFKVGLELTTAVGVPKAVLVVLERGGDVFLDLKFNDIPNTVRGASEAAVAQGVSMFNVHASSGIHAMRQAVEAAGPAKVLAVTVLTSLDETACNGIFHTHSGPKVQEFVRDARVAGAHGIICSPRELVMLRDANLTLGMLMVTPGIRPFWAAAGDQRRITTPADAVRNGADYLVIGRPITNPPPEIGSPVDAARRIADEIAEALKEGDG